jgi:hypothetical protein
MKSVYFLHVNRTAGRFFHKYVFRHIVRWSKDENIKLIRPNADPDDWTHWGWSSEIEDSSYIICLLRDPLECLISYHVAFSNVKTKSDLIERINSIENLQARSFITWKENKVDPHSDINFDKDLILNRLKRVNLLIDSKDINIKTIKSLREKICLDLNINSLPFDDGIKDTDEFRTEGVKDIYNSLSKSDINKIKKINYMDFELYEEAKKIFWTPVLD